MNAPTLVRTHSAGTKNVDGPMIANPTSRLVPFLRVLGSSLRYDRWNQFRRVFRDGLSAIAGRFPHRSKSALPLPILSPGKFGTNLPPLLQLASAYWISQAIYVAAKLRFADVLKDGPASAAQIALATQSDQDSVSRLMRALTTVDVFKVDGSGRFTVTALGKPLQSGVRGSLREMIVTLGEVHYAAWAHLLHSVKTGKIAFESAFGKQMFDYLGQDHAAGNTFTRAMADCSSLSSCAVLLSYDFSGIRSIIDVGGGSGKLLTAILEMYPEMDGTLFDLPSVIAVARESQGANSHPNRCALVSGNFLESVPGGADAFVLSTVIHDWEDDQARRILMNCRTSMKQDSRLLLVEFIVPDGGKASFTRLFDLNMLVMNGGRERTSAEFCSLLDSAGLRLTRIVPTLSPLFVLEAKIK
jgi:hypothetical protein